MNIELRKWSVEDKEVLIKMCNSIDRSFLSDRLPNPYTNASAEWWLTMVKDNEGKKGVFREIVVDGKIVGTISVEQKDDVYRKDSEIGYYLLQEVYSKGIMSEENILLDNIDYANNDEVMAAALFYQYLSEKDSEFLINNNYTKEEVLSGFKQLLVQSGYNNLLYMIKDDE